MYEGRAVSLEDDSFFTGGSRSLEMPPIYNLVRSACDTAQADIAGRQKPKPMFMTTGADWAARRRAKKLDKFVEAQLNERQGNYADSWQVMLDAFLDSARIGVGCVKVWGDADHERVRVERVFPWEIHVDERESRFGDPQNMFHCYDMERDLALEMFCNVEGDEEGNERRRAGIESARTTRTTNQRVVQSVRIREAWRLPFSKKRPGLHVIAVDSTLLSTEEWTDEEFPFVFLFWDKHTIGFWGTGLAEAGEAQQELINDVAERLGERIRICSQKRTYYNPDAVKQEMLQSGGEAEVLIPIKDMTQAPREVPPQPASEAEFKWLADNKQAFYETLGISQMTAQSQKPNGVVAAVAMQTLNDIQTVRFLPKARGYETAFITLGKLMVRAARAIAEMNGGFLAKWPGKQFITEIDWNDVSLDEDMYSIRVASVSQFSRDPSAILEMAQELRQSGDITRETYLSMIGIPDLEQMLGRETAESEYIEELIGRYLDSTNATELRKAGGFDAPEPFLTNKPGAMALFISAYWEAKRDGAPEYCLENLRQYIQRLDKLMQPPPAPPAPAPQMGLPMGVPGAGGSPNPAMPPQLQAVA